MIISFAHRFVFVAIPKTGTHAVRQALRAHLGPDDAEQAGLFVQKRLPIPELAAIQHGHLSLPQVRPYLPDGRFEDYLKFAFVRNPYDRFVSFCAFVTRDTGAFVADPQGVMKSIIAEPPIDHILFRPQHAQLVNRRGELLTDEIGRFETMQESYDRIAARIGIPTAPLEKVNASTHADYRTYYNQELKDGVAKIYARDFELFDYQP